MTVLDLLVDLKAMVTLVNSALRLIDIQKGHTQVRCGV
jgi:hypothetical protein